MRRIFTRASLTLFCCALGLIAIAQAPRKAPKYNSLLWEITGNGLKKPSYLFGTMHVSSKLAFHLSDSFYHALKSTDMVALELDPKTWQPEMFRMQEAEKQLSAYNKDIRTGYINENSFKLDRYEENLGAALSEEPMVINSLLYRSLQQKADFEENTYLDLYIYQTGRKLGKQSGGVENFFETEKIMMEAYQDMAKEKAKKRNYDYDNEESFYDIQKKLQDAYRKGDLDLLDSLEKKTQTSAAFAEKFMYKRNEIHAHSIDTILKKRSLFVGVGAAHLPGDRGVIELLRKMGYKLRPIFMQNRDAVQKEKIDKLRVPVKFNPVTTTDGFVKMMLPGPLFKRDETTTDASWQYSDMENGAYYMLTRVKTHAAILGDNESLVLKKVDSLLYENIPGKILTKTAIEKNGYKGFDITNKTRRGDIQRYNIFVTPFEVLIFKMSGSDDYVQGKEATDFFSSISLKEIAPKPVTYEPSFAGFKLNLPHEPVASLGRSAEDFLDTWHFEAVDKANGNAFMVMKKTVNSYGFIEEDTFDLSLVEESLKSSEMIEKQLSRNFRLVNGYPALDMEYSLKNGGTLNARTVIRGPHYYLVLQSAQKNPLVKEALNSFAVTPFRRGQPELFVDTFYYFRVASPWQPRLDTGLRKMYEIASSEAFLDQVESVYYGTKDRNASFYDDSTGESVVVSIHKFPKYYHSRDTARFFENEYDTERMEKDMVLRSRETLRPSPGSFGYKYVFTDTNSSRMLIYAGILQKNRFFSISGATDTLAKGDDMVSQFLKSFVPEVKDTVSLFRSKLNQFFADLSSKDSLTRARAMEAASDLYFGPESVGRFQRIIDSLRFADKDYFELKSKFISELGYIDDSCCVKEVISYLNNLYERTADTAYFQNPILISLARLKTKESFASLKEHLMQDPPIFEDDYGMDNLFGYMYDTLSLSKMFFPDILQLMSIDDYKSEVTSLLRTMVDSGYLKAGDYEHYFSNLYFDAKIELKRQQSADVLLAKKQSQKEQEGDDAATRTYYNNTSGVDNYAVLLMPFYEKNTAIRKFFDKLLQSKDVDVRMNTAVLLIRNNIPVHDSILLSIAAKDQYRAPLLAQLEDVGKEQYFPASYRKQEDVARSLLLGDDQYEKFYDVQLVGKQKVKLRNTSGYVYFFKYKLKKEDEWKIGLSGIQPDSLSKVSSNDMLVSMTDKKLNAETPESEQFDKQLKRLIFSLRRSSARFYRDSGYGGYGFFDQDRED